MSTEVIMTIIAFVIAGAIILAATCFEKISEKLWGRTMLFIRKRFKKK